MEECICNSCKNLKSIIDEDNGTEYFECSYGYPSDCCEEECIENCNIKCINYICDEEESSTKVVQCKLCGCELVQSAEDGTEGDVFCVKCYLER